MRLPTAIGLVALLAAPLSHAQHPTRLPSTAPPSRSQTASSTAHSAAPADRPLSPAPEWAALANRTADSTDIGLSRRERIGGLYLTFGAIGLTGGTVSGIGVYRLFSTGIESGATFPKALGATLIIPAIGFTALGIYTTIRGIRILQGKAPPVIRIPGSAPSSPPHHQSPLPVTITL